MAKSKDTGSKSLKDTLADIDSHFGKGTVMRMGDRESRHPININWFSRARHCSWHWWYSKRESY